MTRPPQSIAITGGGSGLGAALAESHARPGRRLFLCGRRAGPLNGVADRCRALGASADVETLDVTRAAEVANWIDRIERSGPVDLLIVNAGVFGGRYASDRPERVEIAAPIVATNLVGAIHCAGMMAERMAARGSGHIALVSSLAARLPSADALAYSASKAGLSAYGTALREYLDGTGVTVTVIEPGHIRTAQTDCHRGKLAFRVEASAAAEVIRRGLEARERTISFPWQARAGVTLLRLLPRRLRARLSQADRFTVANALSTGGEERREGCLQAPPAPGPFMFREEASHRLPSKSRPPTEAPVFRAGTGP